MLPDRVSNPGPLTYESGALPIALRGPADCTVTRCSWWLFSVCLHSDPFSVFIIISVFPQNVFTIAFTCSSPRPLSLVIDHPLNNCH